MISYYSNKIKKIICSQLKQTNLRLIKEPGLVYGPLDKTFSFKNIVVFAFWPSHFHLGDQLFYLQLAHYLHTMNIKIIIIGPTPLYHLFEPYDAEYIDISNSSTHHITGAIILSKTDLLSDILPHISTSNFYMGMNYRTLQGKKRISDLICDHTFSKTPIPKPPKIKFRNKFKNIPKTTKIDLKSTPTIFFNPYVASNRLQAFFRRKQIHNIAKQKASEGYQIILIGSKADKKASPQVPTYVMADLRDKISILELFNLFSLPQAKALISYDTFVAHVATLCNLPLITVTKSKKHNEFIAKRFVPFFETSHINKCKLL